ncbi:Spo0B domain-containing protein [Hathewaya massiliensis]|uniref:Spo0B domain-containing protein n=1 Tax=Hathewaya massiliensis TaxID=1964382 RepID=UPI0011593050|nr:Spo0B domain-containing protein [Hathewaya massiliensis]
MEELELFIDKFRIQRHDFMNILQIISGYIQLNQEEEALSYINSISNLNEHISSLYSLGDKYFAFALELCFKEIEFHNKKVDLEVEIIEFQDVYFKKNFEKKYLVLKTLIMDILKKESEKIYIYIYESSNGVTIRLSSFQEQKEFDVAFLNVNEDYDLSDIDIFKSEKDEKLSYELNLKTV